MEREKKAEPASNNRPARVLVIHDSFPLVDRSGADSRLIQIVLALVEEGHSVTYVARSAHGYDPYAAVLADAAIEVFADDGARLRWMGRDVQPHWSLETVLENGKFDLAILSHWFWAGISVAEDYLDDIQRLSPQTFVAVLSDDFHGLRERRAAEISGAPADWERSFDFEERELEIYRRADAVLAISEADRAALIATAPGLKIDVLPAAAQIPPPGPDFTERKGLLFLANFDNPASREGISWFLKEVWPRVRRHIPEISLSLAGNNATVELAAPGSGIRCRGHVPDVIPLFAQHRVFVSPIRFGTGIKTKNLAALANGIPLVTTTVGAEGMSLRNGETALMADGPEEFAEAAIHAYTDSDLWRALAAKGREHVRNHFSAQQLRNRLEELISESLTFRPQRSTGRQTLSVRRVEIEYPNILSHQPREERITARIVGYLRLAERLLAQGHPHAAREQLRHAFGFVRNPVAQNSVFAEIHHTLDLCYQELKEPKPYTDASE